MANCQLDTLLYSFPAVSFRTAVSKLYLDARATRTERAIGCPFVSLAETLTPLQDL